MEVKAEAEGYSAADNDGDWIGSRIRKPNALPREIIGSHVLTRNGTRTSFYRDTEQPRLLNSRGELAGRSTTETNMKKYKKYKKTQEEQEEQE